MSSGTPVLATASISRHASQQSVSESELRHHLVDLFLGGLRSRDDQQEVRWMNINLHIKPGYPSGAKSVFLFAFSAVLISAGFALVASWHLYSSALPIRYDSIVKFSAWTEGQNVFEALWHNGSASWMPALGLYLDTHWGPYGFWSYFVGYGLTAVFFSVYFYLASSRLGFAQGLTLTALFGLAWVLWFNGDQVYWFLWRISETGSQLASLAVCALLILSWNDSPPVKKVLLVSFLFLFSQVHIGYVAPTIAFLVLFVISTSRKRKYSAILCLAFYVVYLVYVDGVLNSFYQKFAEINETETAGGNLAASIVNVVRLSTATTERALSSTQIHGAAFFVQACLFLLVIGLLGIASVKVFKSQDKDSAVFLLAVLSQMGAVVLIALGRGHLYEDQLQEVNRYASYSIIVLFFSVWYLFCLLPNKAMRVLTILATGLLLLVNVPRTFDAFAEQEVWTIGSQNTSFYQVLKRRSLVDHAPQSDLDLKKGSPKDLESMTQDVTDLFERSLINVVDTLEADGVAQFGAPGWRWLSSVKSFEHVHELEGCVGEFSYGSTDGNVLRFSATVDDPASFDFAVVTDAKGALLGFGQFRKNDKLRLGINLLEGDVAHSITLLNTSGENRAPQCVVHLRDIVRNN